MAGQSPSQTVGPFFHNCLIRGNDNQLINEQTSGQRIIVEGQVFDGDGVPVPDAMVEIWQADSNGHFNHANDPNHAKADPHFRGYGRSATVENGRFTFHTVKPGIIDSEVTPHINMRVFARGMLIHTITRLYFADQDSNKNDPVFNSLPDARRSTLLAALKPDSLIPTYRFNIHLQGEQETVFFNP